LRNVVLEEAIAPEDEKALVNINHDPVLVTKALSQFDLNSPE
jgi:hypothetical protein